MAEKQGMVEFYCNPFKACSDMMESWTETGNFTMFFESTADMKETAFKAMMLNLEMYDAQLRYADGLVRDSFEIAIDWAKENAGISNFRMGTNLDPYAKFRRFTMDFYELMEEAFKEGNSLEEFYKKWVELGEKAKDAFVEDSKYYGMVSEFIEKNTEFIKSTEELYRNAIGFSSPANGYAADKSFEESEAPKKKAA